MPQNDERDRSQGATICDGRDDHRSRLLVQTLFVHQKVMVIFIYSSFKRRVGTGA
jgi:hypothetical protein